MSKKFHAHDEEVLHYTTAAGLRGIVSSKTLWASHSRFLNDTEEGVSFSKRLLSKILSPIFKKHVENSEDVYAHVQSAEHLGVDQVELWLSKIVNGFTDAQLTAEDNYITAFSTPEDKWESQNGLLSQWRGYGLDRGYAIVFDVKGLEKLIKTEGEMYFEERLAWDHVRYHMKELSSLRDAHGVKHFKQIRKGLNEYLKTEDIETVNPAFDSIAMLSAFHKHRGFHEEREVRIVVSKPSPKVGPAPSNTGGKSSREVHSHPRDGADGADGAAVPCIHLFEHQDLKALPIRRVIVGPHHEKQERKRTVEILLGDHGINAKMLVSDTPFRGK